MDGDIPPTLTPSLLQEFVISLIDICHGAVMASPLFEWLGLGDHPNCLRGWRARL